MAKYDFLYARGEMVSADINECELEAVKGDTLLHQMLSRVLAELDRVKHEAADPMYLYAGSRISRMALMVREAVIDKLRDEAKNGGQQKSG